MMLFHQIERAIHKQKMRESLKSEAHWSSFDFDLKTWESIQEEEGEFSWEGHMFDIISCDVQGDVIHVIAFNDVKESGIVRLMKRWASENDEHDQDLSLNLLKWSMSTFLPTALSFATPVLLSNPTTSRSWNDNSWREGYRTILSPPPLG